MIEIFERARKVRFSFISIMILSLLIPGYLLLIPYVMSIDLVNLMIEGSSLKFVSLLFIFIIPAIFVGAAIDSVRRIIDYVISLFNIVNKNTPVNSENSFDGNENHDTSMDDYENANVVYYSKVPSKIINYVNTFGSFGQFFANIGIAFIVIGLLSITSSMVYIVAIVAGFGLLYYHIILENKCSNVRNEIKLKLFDKNEEIPHEINAMDFSESVSFLSAIAIVIPGLVLEFIAIGILDTYVLNGEITNLLMRTDTVRFFAILPIILSASIFFGLILNIFGKALVKILSKSSGSFAKDIFTSDEEMKYALNQWKIRTPIHMLEIPKFHATYSRLLANSGIVVLILILIFAVDMKIMAIPSFFLMAMFILNSRHEISTARDIRDYQIVSHSSEYEKHSMPGIASSRMGETVITESGDIVNLQKMYHIPKVGAAGFGMQAVHIALIGKTGSGKTTYTKRLIKENAMTTLIIDRHWEYGDIADKIVQFSSIKKEGADVFISTDNTMLNFRVTELDYNKGLFITKDSITKEISDNADDIFPKKEGEVIAYWLDSPSRIVNDLIAGEIVKNIMESAFNKTLPGRTMLVNEEAHRLSGNEWIRSIAAEGRKFDVFLVSTSQTPLWDPMVLGNSDLLIFRLLPRDVDKLVGRVLEKSHKKLIYDLKVGEFLTRSSEVDTWFIGYT